MLVLEIRNISQMANISDYEYEVWVTTIRGTKKIIAKGTIEKHIRSDGWKQLVRRILDESKEVG